MKAKKMLIGLILASYTLPSAHPVLAAPFCAAFPDRVNCWYYTYEECLSAAGTEGYCAVNSSQIRQPSVVAPLCVVNPHGGAPQCFYYDAKLCNDAAAASGGVCLGTKSEVPTTGQENVPTTGQGNVPTTEGNRPMTPGVNMPLLSR
jgi:hypothetical protein